MLSASWRPVLVGVHLVLLAGIAWFGARATSALVAGRLDAPRAASVPPPAPAAVAAPAEPKSAYAVIHERDVFNATKGRAPVDGPAGNAKRTALNEKLWGTALDADPSRSYAIIEDQATRKQALYRVGESILDTATLARVEWDRVVLDHDGEEEVLELSFARASTAPAAAPQAAGAAAERIRKTADNKFLIDRREVESTLENMNQIYTQARAVPYFENGKTVGFRVFSIKPGSVFEKIGLQNGDVIQRVNGVEITDPGKALALFTELQNEGHVALDLQRNKQTKSFSYEIR
jgi:general secretion pathway protein C